MSLLIKLRENKNFTSNEQLVAKYIMNNYKKIKELNAENIAKKTFTSLATVTRLCKKIGLKGYLEFKMLLIEEIANLEKDNFIFENGDIDKNNDTQMIIEKLNKLSISSLKESKLLQNPQDIEEAVNLINEKEVIDFYGNGASHIVGLDAQYKFMRIGKLTNAFNSWDKQYIQAINSNSKHLAIIISYSGKTKEMLEIADILAEKGVKTISITNYSNNPLTQKCSLNLFVSSKEALKRSAAIYSRISMLNLIDVIYLKYSNMNYNYVLKKIKETEIKK